MFKLKSIGVLSAAKIQGVVMAFMGLVFGFIFFLGITVASFFIEDKTGQAFAIIGGIAYLIFLPLIYGVMGFVMGAITAFIYNLAAKWIGGLEIELEKIKK